MHECAIKVRKPREYSFRIVSADHYGFHNFLKQGPNRVSDVLTGGVLSKLSQQLLQLPLLTCPCTYGKPHISENTKSIHKHKLNLK